MPLKVYNVYIGPESSSNLTEETIMPLYKKILLGVGIGIGSIVLFFALMFVGLSFYTSGLKSPIEKQLASIRAEDYAVAYSFTTVDFQKNTSIDAFKKFINEYSGLRNNESISYDERKIENGIGFVSARLKSRSGAETPVLYQLIKEHNEWRIQSLIINPKPASRTTSSLSNNVEPTNLSSTDNFVNQVVLSNTYRDPKYKFEIKYPSDWTYSLANNGMVTFKGREGTSSSQTSFLIRTFKQSRQHPSVQSISNSIKNLIAKNVPDMKIIEENVMPPLTPDSKYEGIYTIYTYSVNNIPFGHLQVIAYSGQKRLLYILDYTTPASQFAADLPIAKAMIISFAVQK